jgi:hypothetical protein
MAPTSWPNTRPTAQSDAVITVGWSPKPGALFTYRWAQHAQIQSRDLPPPPRTFAGHDGHEQSLRRLRPAPPGPPSAAPSAILTVEPS